MRSSVVALSLLVLIASAPAYAHASLVSANPSAGSALNAAPGEVTLTFTDKLEVAFSRITVTDSTGVDVTQGKIEVSGNTMRISLKPLNGGTYTVNWRAVSTDTHKTDGSFAFSVVR